MGKYNKKNKMDFARELDFSEILTNPILDIGARFWEAERYAAFKVCYRSMRKIDDLVDEYKVAGGDLSEKDVHQIRLLMTDWLGEVKRGEIADPFVEEFLHYVNKFKIPLWPWDRLVGAMTYDLNHHGFKSFLTFLRYTEGAAIAPASIFMHLCGVTQKNGEYLEPSYDIRLAARPLAIFSYLVHIIRDFEKDQKDNLQYFASDLLERFGLDHENLRRIAATQNIPAAFRALMTEYVRIGEYYRVRARKEVDRTMSFLETRYRVSLEIIYQLYLQVFERFDPEHGSFSARILQPVAEEIENRIRSVLADFRDFNY
ncbi:MAG: squalene/phytoene synthase family protein [Candidatus Zixiibacteriota bacterium]